MKGLGCRRQLYRTALEDEFHKFPLVMIASFAWETNNRLVWMYGHEFLLFSWVLHFHSFNKYDVLFDIWEISAADVVSTVVC
jgi:hypothetical protein